VSNLGWILAIAIFGAPECVELAKPAQTGVAAASQEQTRFTNADLIAMVQAGIEKATIIAAMHTLEPAFDTSAEGLTVLREAGVHDDLILEIFGLASVDTASRTATMWRIGTFDRREDDLDPQAEFPPTVRYAIEPDGSHDGYFPAAHIPRDDRLNVAHAIHITFHAEPGRYLLSVGQLLTRRPETISVLLDGAPVGQYTTVLEYKIHEIPLRIPHAGQHTLTFDAFSGNDGYLFDALELKLLPR